MRPPLIILAGGKGTRLGELTRDIPKPMVDVHGKPFLYWLIKHYWNQGFKDIFISTGYQAHVIEEYNWPTPLFFFRDRYLGDHETLYSNKVGTWVVNGDTFIPDVLPEIDGPCILTHNDVDAGAQRPGMGKIKNHRVSGFYDIGTPYGLGTFREYFKTHPIYIDELRQNVTISLNRSENEDV